jgi:acid phosphatase class B
MKVIIDIDNTLSIATDRFKQAEKENGKTDWDFVHAPENMIKDKPNLPMIELVKGYKENGFEVIVLTGRPESTKKVTKEWLEKYNILYDKLYMRSWEDNFLKAPAFKRKIYETEIKENVFCAYDDDQRVIDVWVNLGIICFKVFVI